MPETTTAPKVLIYDIDRGLKSLADDARIKEIFGYLPRRFIRTKSFIDLFIKMHKAEVLKTEDELGEILAEQFTMKGDVQIEVLDSITAYQGQTKKEVRGDADKLSLPMWGEVGESMEEMVLLLARTNTHVIILGHTKESKDDDLGIIRHVPALSGRMQNEIGRHFDLVLYTGVETDAKTGKRYYYWQVLADERRSAKCRIEAVSKYAEKEGGRIPQDFGLLFSLMLGKSVPEQHTAVKILILGDTGTGKTYSLRTLKGVKL